MTTSKLFGVHIRGIASAVPEETVAWQRQVEQFGDDAARIAESTGVSSRHMAGTLCTSDLCFASAERLLAEMDWDRASIDLLVFVSQTPDYVLPATSCSLHGRLGLATHCASFDVGLGCSGYVYGLWLASHLLAGGAGKRALVLVGDTISRIISPNDRSVAMLFGDAGTATALERGDASATMTFQMGTDGRGAENIIVPGGGFRSPRGAVPAERTEREAGNVRSDEDLFMDGAEVFAFTQRAVPALVTSLLESAEWTMETLDGLVLHQANRFMLRHLGKKLKVPEAKLVVTLADYGNTSSASIPLAITHALRDKLTSSSQRLVLAGFGVGWSWGAAAITCGPIVAPPLIEVPGGVP